MHSRLKNAFRTNRDSAAQPFRRPGFTLVELMVVIVIVSIVASLSLAGLGVARQKSKIDATKATIRKINEPIMDQYDSFSSRFTGSGSSALIAIRQIMVEEMPDSWADVLPIGTGTTAAGKAYARYQQASYNNNGKLWAYQSAECLFMIITRSGYEPFALENFRAAEVGDVDADGLKEFLDAWGNPIAFLRWAPGFSSDTNPIASLGLRPFSDRRSYSAIQVADPGSNHDSLDSAAADSFAFQMYPLIFSGGPDEFSSPPNATLNEYGIITTGSVGWPTTVLTDICRAVRQTTGSNYVVVSGSFSNKILVGSPDPDNPNPAYRDNVTNHDFLGRGR